MKSIGGTLFSVGNLVTGHLSGNSFDGHSSGHTGSNDTGLSFYHVGGPRKRAVTDIQHKLEITQCELT